jgi:hypothetical protein
MINFAKNQMKKTLAVRHW